MKKASKAKRIPSSSKTKTAAPKADHLAPRKIRYAVVGLGHIAQTAILPAFQHAQKDSQLQALVSGDPLKLRQLGKKYGVTKLYSYEEYEECLASGEIDAVYIATPNHLHQHFAEIAASYKVHVLCEKPMAVNEGACLSMLGAARENQIKMMVAYRLHFDSANLRAVELAKSGRLGDLKVFNSTFTMQVRDAQNIRLDRASGGGPLHDIGIYCINASRYLFREEPIEVFATAVNSGQERFRDVEETVSAVLRYPGNRVAAFSVSFGAADSANYDLIGTKGRIRLENAYEYAGGMDLKIYHDDKVRTQHFAPHDQFAPEIEYFSECIRKDREPEPSGVEGLADVRVIDALFESLHLGLPVHLAPHNDKTARPRAAQARVKPAVVRPPKPVHAHSAGGRH